MKNWRWWVIAVCLAILILANLGTVIGVALGVIVANVVLWELKPFYDAWVKIR